MQFNAANCNSMGRVITQTRSRTFQTVDRAFEALRENHKLSPEFEMLGRMFKRLAASLCYNTAYAAPVSLGNIYTPF